MKRERTGLWWKKTRKAIRKKKKKNSSSLKTHFKLCKQSHCCTERTRL